MVFPQQARQGQNEEASYSVHQSWWDSGRVLSENQKDVAAVAT